MISKRLQSRAYGLYNINYFMLEIQLMLLLTTHLFTYCYLSEVFLVFKKLIEMSLHDSQYNCKI
jgi:hypothetical protein